MPTEPLEIGTVVEVSQRRGEGCIILEVIDWPPGDTVMHRRCVDVAKGTDIQIGDVLWWFEGLLWLCRERDRDRAEGRDVKLVALRQLGKFYASRR